jgi:hypothetical protein
MEKEIKKLKGANMDVDLISNENLHWKQDKCPWEAEDGKQHKCAVKNISLCKYFKGVEYPDNVLCAFPNKLKK